MIDFKKLSATLAMVTLLASSSAYATAYIDSISGAQRGVISIEITRQNEEKPRQIVKLRLDQSMFELKTGDILELKNPNVTVVIRAETGEEIKFYQDSHKGNKIILMDKSALPISERFWQWIKKPLTHKEPGQPILAGSRGSDGCRNTDTDISTLFATAIPAQNKINSKNHELFIPWQGGLPPYIITLADATGKSIATHQENSACETRFTHLQLQVGQYTLNIQDAKHANIRFELDIVDTAPPMMPEALQSEPLPDELRTQYYLNWLTKQDAGRWTLESLQLAQPWRNSNNIQNWLDTWGGGQYQPAK
ncbi:MAG: hypothetical protein ABL869_03200 [Candidatus Nitrotoga sp.]